MLEQRIDSTAQNLDTDDFELRLLLETIYYRYYFDFRSYAKASIKRRLIQACKHFKCSSFSLLQHKILHEPALMPTLIKYLTVPVSDLFRDPLYFKTIREQLVPHLRTYPSLNIWVAGCSTGEELYSLAILFREEGLDQKTTFYATDINVQSLKQAKLGIYGLDRIKKFSENYQKAGGKESLSDYYTVAYGAAKFDSSLQNNVVFSEHNLVSDADFAEMQLISCRNVLIYFEKDLQARVFNLFSNSLSHKGFLGLGSKETIRFSPLANVFNEFSQDTKIYQKLGVPNHATL